MEKNKILTSLTLAGVLTAGVLGGNSKAASNSQGVCKNILSGESLVPYILESKDDFVTSARLQAEYTTASNLELKYSDRVSTGDTFTTTSGKKTVIIYGDVNKDGKVSTLDASLTQNIVLGDANVDNYQRAAADVRRNNNSVSITTIDASSIQEFVLNGGDYVNVKPVGEKDEAVEEGYTIVVGDNNVINTENNAKVQVALKLDNVLTKEKSGLKVRVKDSNGTKKASVAAKAVPAHTTVVEELLSAVLDASTYDDGTYTFELVENENASDEKVLARTTVTKNVVVPSAAKVTTERTGWDKATLSFENSQANGETTNAKVYYVVLAKGANKPTFAQNSNTKNWEFSAGTTYSEETPNGKLTDKELKEKLTDRTEYDLYYVLENTYGSRSVVEGPVSIKNGTQNTVPEAVDKTTIKVPDLKKGEKTFTWTAKAGETYKVVVYKDGNVIAEKNPATSPLDITDLNGDTKVNCLSKGAGKYKIEITTNAKATDKKDSEPVMSDEVEVKALNTVSDVKFEVKQAGPVLTFKDSNASADVNGYTVTYYEYNESTKLYATSGTTVSSSNIVKNADGTFTAKLTLNPNKAYKAEIIANAKTTQLPEGTGARLDIINSEKAEIVDFFNIVPTSAFVSNTDVTVKLDISSLANVTIKGSKLSNYRVEAYKANADHLETEPEFVKTTCTSAVDGKNIIVSGLEQNTDYVFKLYASVNGNEGQSAYIYKKDAQNNDVYIKTSRTNPEIKDKVIVNNVADAKTGTVYHNGNTLKVNGGEDIDLTDNYSADFIATLGVIDTLNAGDKVTLDGDDITIALGSASNGKTIAFGATIEDKNVNINGQGYSCTLTSTLGKEAKEVVLSGNNSRFVIGDSVAGYLKTDKVTVNNGVVVANTTSTPVSVSVASGTATINGVKVTTSSNVEIETCIATISSVATKKLSVKVSGTITNNLIFENLTESNVTEKQALIEFVDADGKNEAKQLGTVTIKTNDGKVSVQTVGGVNVSSALNVEVNKGQVDVLDTALTGNKNITVTHVKDEAPSTIEVILDKKAPFNTTSGKHIDIKQFNTDEDVYETDGAETPTKAKINPADGKTMGNVVKFLNNLNLPESANASIEVVTTTMPNGTEVSAMRLTIKGDVTNYTVPTSIDD